jgi:RimJ/RimL family protein N-acetyltransferase
MGAIESRIVNVRGGRVRIRSAIEADAAAWLEHRRRLAVSTAYTVTELSEIDEDVEKQRETIRENRERDGSLSLLAEVVGEAAAPDDGQDAPAAIIATLVFRSGARRRIAHHGSFGIGVDEQWRGRGIGAALIESLLDWAAAHPVLEKVTLGAFATNERALALYQRLGFVEEGRTVLFVRQGPGDYVDDINMCIFVKPGVAPEGFTTWRAGR